MSAIFGMLITIVSGALNGSFAVPMKKTVKWEWENTWFIYALTAMILIPLIITFLFVPDLLSIYQQTPSGVLWQTFLFGVGWGVGSVLFGLGLYLVGLSLGFTIMIGIISVSGALIPMLVHYPASLLTPGGLFIMLAMVVTIFGVMRCSLAGKTREMALGSVESSDTKKGSFKLGLVVCILSGVLSSMLNFAFHFGSPIAEKAHIYLGNSATAFQTNHTIWYITLLGGFVPFLIYCGYLLIHNHSWKKYAERDTSSYWLWASFMGVMWMGCIVLYGIGASILGKLGTTVGWLVLMAFTVLVGNLWGVITGEWKGAPKKAKIQMIQGLSLLMVSVVLVGVGKMLLS